MVINKQQWNSDTKAFFQENASESDIFKIKIIFIQASMC